MNDELIYDIYISKQSFSYKGHLERKKIQDSYWEKFIEDFNRLIDQNKKVYEEEKNTIAKIGEVIESDQFQSLLGNAKYYEAVNSVVMSEMLGVGKSHILLLNIYHELTALCDKYKKEYDSFVENTEKLMKADCSKVDAETKSVFESIFYANVCKESFYNILSNNNMI